MLLTAHLRKHGILTQISERVCFARRRFGRYDVIDFLAVLFGYAISGERTLEEFYKQLQPFAILFMALFERDQLPFRSALSRFLAALTEAPVEALRTLFLDDLLVRPLTSNKQTGGLVDRVGNTWMVFDLDGTREPPANTPYHRGKTCLRPFVGWMTSARLATGAANAGKSSGHAPRCRRRTVISGSAVSATVETGAIGRNCARGSPPLTGIWRPISFHQNVHCSGSTANMAMEQCSPMWLGSRL